MHSGPVRVAVAVGPRRVSGVYESLNSNPNSYCLVNMMIKTMMQLKASAPLEVNNLILSVNTIYPEYFVLYSVVCISEPGLGKTFFL